MKGLLIVTLLMFSAFAKAQPALANYGNLKVHNSGEIGFHIDVINDGTSDDNEGFAGFYNDDNPLSFSGANQMNFEDLEIDVVDDLLLFTSLGITGEQFFTNGRVITPRLDNTVKFKYLDDNLYTGDTDDRHIDGYAEFNGDFDFLFPIGDAFEMKQLGVSNNGRSQQYTSAFFKEDPNVPSTFTQGFTTTNFDASLDIVSNIEYWYFDGGSSTVDVTLNWTPSSEIELLAEFLEDLRICGWDSNAQQWINLGNLSTTGDFDRGSITSTILNPEDYQIYTISSVREVGSNLVVYNGITPDGDGSNDTFVIRGIEDIDGTELQIFNRWGVVVYQKYNYDNSFDGVSSGRVSIRKNENLPEGTYYYVLTVPNREQTAGYLYINR